MTFTERYKKNTETFPVFILGLMGSLGLLFYEIIGVLSKSNLQNISDGVGLMLMFSFIGQLILLFLGTHHVLTLITTVAQHVLTSEVHKTPRAFNLNTLAYRLFYAPISRTNLLFIGFFIGLVNENRLFLTSPPENDWDFVGLIVLGFIKATLLVFFVQSVLITLWYLFEVHVGKRYGKWRHAFLHRPFAEFKKQAKEPANLIVSLVVAPVLFWMLLLLSASLHLSVPNTEPLFTAGVFGFLVYTFVTVILTLTTLTKRKQKTKA